MEYYSAVKKSEEMLPFATKLMGREGIVLSEGIHRKTNTPCFTYIWNLMKINQIISQLNWGQKECFKFVKRPDEESTMYKPLSLSDLSLYCSPHDRRVVER